MQDRVGSRPPEGWKRAGSFFVAVPEQAWWESAALPLMLEAAAGVGCLAVLVHRYDLPTGRLCSVAVSGFPPEILEAWAQVPIEADVAPARAVRRGGFIWDAGDSLGVGASGTAAIALPGRDGPVGALSVIMSGAGEPDDVQWSLWRAVAAWAADLEPAGGSALTIRMGALSVALAEAVTAREIVRAVAEHVVPAFGAYGVAIFSLEGDRLRVVDAPGYPREFLDSIEKAPFADTVVGRELMRTRAPVFAESDEIFRFDPVGKSLARVSPMASWAFLPLIASGRSVGFCEVGFSEPRSFSEREQTLLTTLSGLIGQALERARLYDAEHARAQGLQHSLLPRALPTLPSIGTAACYLPAGHGDEVGGDWYDVIPLSADRVALVIGDVMGHGITEAGAMGQLRTAVRTLADLEFPPDELLSRLNDLARDLGEDFYATCLYAVFDPVARTCTYALAGHLPPAVVHSDGTVHIPEVTADPPLGAADPPLLLHELSLPDECLIALYTDGLIESVTRTLEQGQAELKRALAGSTRAGCFRAENEQELAGRLERLCESVVSALLPERERLDDDAALLLACPQLTEAANVASRTFPADPRTAGQAREYVRERLAEWGLEQLATTTELLVSELVGNVVRHAKGPIRLRLIRSRTLICEVYDGSLSTPRIRHPSFSDEGGRGLQLVAALTTRWGARYLHDGKCVWAEQQIPSA